MNIDPRNMSFRDWTDQMGLLLDSLMPIYRFDESEDKWKDWANYLADQLGLDDPNVPNPELFDDWRDWAMRFNQVVILSG